MVEWKKLGEVCSRITDGSHFSPKSVESGYFMPSVKDMTYDGFNFDSCKQITEEDYKSLVSSGCKPQIGDVLIAKDGSMLKYVFPIKENKDIVVLSSIAILTPCKSIINSSYLSHYLRQDFIKEKTIREFSSKGGVPRIILKNFKKIIIPIPSLEEQNRIVGILDTFTYAFENLKQQIAYRKKQLEQYRNELLDLEGHEGVSMRPLGDLCEIIRGNGVQKTDFTEEGVGCIHYGQIYTHYGLFTYTTNKFVSEATAAKAKKASKGDIIMTSTSENVEDVCKSVAYLGEDDIAVSSHALILKHNLDPKYLAHCTATYNFFKQKYKLAHGAKVVEIKPEEVAKIKIPVVAKPGQSLIVFILDKFEAIIANLEKQLELRQKQYEYYRNQLLTFE